MNGWTLAHHAASQQTLDMLTSQGWDYVILQEQSIIPWRPDGREQVMYSALRVLHERNQHAGTEAAMLINQTAGVGSGAR